MPVVSRLKAWVILILCTGYVFFVSLAVNEHGWRSIFNPPSGGRDLGPFALWALVAIVVALFMIVALLFGKKVPAAKIENEQPHASDPTDFGTWL